MQNDDRYRPPRTTWGYVPITQPANENEWDRMHTPVKAPIPPSPGWDRVNGETF